MPDPTYHSDLHRAAIQWAEAGFFVLPCRERGKQPILTGWETDATQDIEKINAWWKENPNYNIGINVGLSGHVVIDVDLPQGVKTLEELEQTHGKLPETFTTSTPRGGLHYWFEGETRNSVSTGGLGLDIDTRGQKGQVLVPPSYVVDPKKKIDGPYTYVKDDIDVAPLPRWVPEKLKKTEGVEASAAQGLPVERAKLEEVLSHIDPGTDRDTWRDVIASIRNTNVVHDGRPEDDEGWQWSLAHHWSEGGLHEQYNELNRPSGYTNHDEVDTAWETLPPKEGGVGFGTLFHLATKQGYEGAPPLAPVADTFKDAIDIAAKEPAADVKPSRFRLLNREQWGDVPPPTWQIENLMQENTTNLCLGKEGSYKSFLVLDMALAISTGTETFGSKTEPGCVAYGALEGLNNIISSRIDAWCLARGYEGKPADFFVGQGPIAGNPEELQEFGEQLEKSLAGRPCKLIVIDTVALSMLGLDENSAADVGRFYYALNSLREYFKCSLIAIHHTGHSGVRARGSSAFQANFDAVWMVKADKETKAVELWVNKQKDGAEPEHPFTFKGKSIGRGMAFHQTTLDEHKAMTHVEELYSNKQIGAALRALGAAGDKTVTTEVLASQVAPTSPDMTQLQRESAQAGAAQALKKLAKTDLAGYCQGSGRTLTWSMPG